MDTLDGGGEARDELAGPFIEATRAALGEMAATEVVVKAVGPKALDEAAGDIVAVVELTAATSGLLVLRFPERTAAALAGRILAGVTAEVDDGLVRDCIGEIANVVAGQAKAMLADTPYRFTFSLPRVLAGAGQEPRPGPGPDCLVIAFGSDLGNFTLHVLRSGPAGTREG